jgi:hypothetical protein
LISKSKDFNLEAGCPDHFDWCGRFQQPQGWILSAKERVRMFDNEIDWVTRLECSVSAVRRTGWQQDPRAYTYKAEHKP